jgi:hypothetical protein
MVGENSCMGATGWMPAFLEDFLQRHHRQDLSMRRLKPEELFYPATLETDRI